MTPKQQEADRILLAHIQDMERRGAYRSFTAFLDMRQYLLCKAQLQEGTYRFFGGWPEAERGILCIHPLYAQPEDDEFPITCLTYTFPPAYPVTHRDVLGCLMAQQVQRDMVGDILVSPGRVQCFVTGAAVSAGMQLTKIGSVGVRVTDALPFAADFVRGTKEIVGTVASPRLDAVLHAALHIRREACAEAIRGQLVTLNYQEAAEPAKQVAQGDVFSVRGYGKFRVAQISEPTKKGRLHIVIEKFV